MARERSSRSVPKKEATSTGIPWRYSERATATEMRGAAPKISTGRLFELLAIHLRSANSGRWKSESPDRKARNNP